MFFRSRASTALYRLIVGMVFVLIARPVVAEDMNRMALVFGNSDS